MFEAVTRARPRRFSETKVAFPSSTFVLWIQTPPAMSQPRQWPSYGSPLSGNLGPFSSETQGGRCYYSKTATFCRSHAGLDSQHDQTEDPGTSHGVPTPIPVDLFPYAGPGSVCGFSPPELTRSYYYTKTGATYSRNALDPSQYNQSCYILTPRTSGGPKPVRFLERDTWEQGPGPPENAIWGRKCTGKPRFLGSVGLVVQWWAQGRGFPSGARPSGPESDPWPPKWVLPGVFPLLGPRNRISAPLGTARSGPVDPTGPII